MLKYKALDEKKMWGLWVTVILKLGAIRGVSSGVATGWHGWTMSRGPGAKGALERETPKKMKNRKGKKGRKEKTEQNFSNTRTGGGPTRYPH